MLVFMLVSGPHLGPQYIYSSAFWHPGQLLKMWDSPRDSRTVGAYEHLDPSFLNGHGEWIKNRFLTRQIVDSYL